MFDKSRTFSYSLCMAKKIYDFSSAKNKTLIETRQISFEEIIVAIGNDQLLDIIEHPNPTKYLNQKIYVVRLGAYAYLVPFIEKDDGVIFLKTIFPSRKATKQYLIEEKAHES